MTLCLPAEAPALSEREFTRVAHRIERLAGIVLEPHKRPMLAARLARRMRHGGHRGIGAYMDMIDRGSDRAEVQGFIDALTTNQTGMFREPHHFAHLERVLAARTDAAPLRLWSAGCASGEEAFSIALTVAAARGRLALDDRILATDIDSAMIARARRGVVAAERCTGLEPRHAAQLGRAAGGGRQMPPQLLGAIRFRRLNLLEPWPLQGYFEAIFCRNVMIYFSAATRAALVDRLAARLVPGGHLYLGHAELLLERHTMLQACGKSVYRRVEGA
ncbi:CheR family methyltransferase [Halovulum marinum]|nr:protein-glutamate O-methyltransferase CheR [Halovulum marinum]